LLALLKPVLLGSTANDWVARLRPLGLAVGVVTDLGDALDGPLVRERGMVVTLDTDSGPLRMLASPVRFDGDRGSYRMPPRLHEHTDELISGPD
jgi:CoA:oxalate CoA-transferase